MFPEIDSGIATEDAPVSYWPICSLTLVTVPEAFAKVSSTQFPSLIKLHVKVDWCCIELHHGSVLGTLPLLSLAIARLWRKLVKNLSTKTRPQLDPPCNSTQSRANSKWPIELIEITKKLLGTVKSKRAKTDKCGNPKEKVSLNLYKGETYDAPERSMFAMKR